MRSPSGSLRALAIAGTIVLLGASGTVVAQEASPPADRAPVEVVLQDVDGNEVGSASLNETDAGVEIRIDVDGLAPGDHGIHIHETGTCDPAAGEGPFSTAGGHFNPTGASHGPGPQGHMTSEHGAGHMMATPGSGSMMMDMHAGDLGNITVADDGTGELAVITDLVTLAPGAETSLNDADGSALVVHEDPDDLSTDPSGNSGARIACGVIFEPMDGTPVVTTDDEDEDEDTGDGSAGDGEAYRPGDEPVQALDQLVFSPSVIVASPGDTIEAINVGALEHDFVVDELGIGENLPNGQVVEITIPEDAEPGEYVFYCSVPGHRAAGMEGTLIIEGA